MFYSGHFATYVRKIVYQPQKMNTVLYCMLLLSIFCNVHTYCHFFAWKFFKIFRLSLFLHAFVTFCNVFADFRTTYGLSASYACGVAAWHCWARTSNSLKVCTVYINIDILCDCFLCNATTDVFFEIYFFWMDILIDVKNYHNWWVPSIPVVFACRHECPLKRGFTVQCMWKEKKGKRKAFCVKKLPVWNLLFH